MGSREGASPYALAELNLGQRARRVDAEACRFGPLAAALLPAQPRAFTRFAAAGRSTLFPADSTPRASAVQLSQPDCPPDRLRRFLHTLCLKLAVAPVLPLRPHAAGCPRPRDHQHQPGAARGVEEARPPGSRILCRGKGPRNLRREPSPAP